MSHLILPATAKKFGSRCWLACTTTGARCMSTEKHTIFTKRRIGVSVVGIVVVAGCGTLLWMEMATVHRRISTSTDVVNIDRKINPYIYFFEAQTEVKNQLHKSRYTLKRLLDLDKISQEPWLPWLQSHSDDPWTLLRLCRSSKSRTRALGVDALANIDSWDDYQYRYIAQASDHRTAVALARMPNIDPRFFRPPPALPPLTQGKTVLQQLQRLLSRLPGLVSDPCVQYFTLLALQLRPPPEDRSQVWSFSGLIPEMGEDSEELDVGISESELLCLEALAHQSTVAAQCRHVVEGGGLELMRRLAARAAPPDNGGSERKFRKMQNLVARILGNLALQPNLCPHICQAGWVPLLMEWSRSGNLAVKLLAARALYNLEAGLQSDLPTPSVLHDGVYLIHPHLHSQAPVHADIVFVHGIHGGALKTWRQRDPRPSSSRKQSSSNGTTQSMCWPLDWLSEDCHNVRILAVDYETQLTQWNASCPFEQEKRTLAHQSRSLLRKLQAAGVGTRPVIWVGHSLGGLLIKQLLEQCQTGEEDAQEEITPSTSSAEQATDSRLPGGAMVRDSRRVLEQTQGILFYSVPHRGVQLADLSSKARRLLHPSVEVLELSADSQHLRSLHQFFQELVSERNIPCLSFGETEKSSVSRTLPKILIVPSESSDPGVGNFFAVSADHINVCKPADRSSELYLLSLRFLRRCVRQGWLLSMSPANLYFPEFGHSHD